jgi:cellobiose phosphorylase
LYALRGVFAAGDTKRGLEYLHYYSNRRLLGEHVPYPVEAYPEGGQRHLSAESGLYCRIFTEGLFGIRPVGLNSFTITPQLPEGWDFMKLKNVHGFQKEFDIEVRRESGKIRLTVKSGKIISFNKLVENGRSFIVKF